MYRAVDASMIRASVFPVTGLMPCCPAPVADAGADAENCRRWIKQVWEDEPS